MTGRSFDRTFKHGVLTASRGSSSPAWTCRLTVNSPSGHIEVAPGWRGPVCSQSRCVQCRLGVVAFQNDNFVSDGVDQRRPSVGIGGFVNR